MLAFGAIGWYDDWIKIVRRDPNGLKSRWKYLLQSLFGVAAGVFLYLTADPSVSASTTFFVPLLKNVAIPLGVFFVVVAYFWIVGFSNAVNLTDGLDGLAIMPTVLVACALGVFAYASGNAVFSTYLQIPQIPGRSEQHPSELQSLMRISYAVFCLKKKKKQHKLHTTENYNTKQTDHKKHSKNTNRRQPKH